MQKAIKTLVVVSSLVFGAAQAGVGIDYAKKDKVDSAQENIVLGLSVSDKIGIGYDRAIATELRVESENVNGVTPKKHEGLVQFKGALDVYKVNVVVPVTFYGAAGVGLKSKSDSSFNYYVAGVGAKTSVAGVGLDLASRLRSPFGEGSNGTGPKYRTVENSLTATYAVAKEYTVGVKYARERGDLNFNTVGFAIKHTF